MFEVLFKILGIIPVLFGLLFSAAFIGVSSISLYQTLTGDLVNIGMFDLGLFMVTELGTLPNPVTLTINLFLLFAGFYILKQTCVGFLQDYFNYQFKEKKESPISIKIRTVIKYFFLYILMVGFIGVFTLLIGGLALSLPVLLIDWLFDANIGSYASYYFDKIIVSGSTAFSYLKVWIVGIPGTYFLNIKEHGWKIRN
mgnify:CR=1 FL=1